MPPRGRADAGRRSRRPRRRTRRARSRTARPRSARSGRGAVDRHELAVAAGARVDVARREILAGAGLAGEQHGHRRARGAIELGEHAPRGRAACDEADRLRPAARCAPRSSASRRCEARRELVVEREHVVGAGEHGGRRASRRDRSRCVAIHSHGAAGGRAGRLARATWTPQRRRASRHRRSRCRARAKRAMRRGGSGVAETRDPHVRIVLR